MSLPRNIVPGVTWFVTRRVTRRHYLLRPDADGMLQQIYWYVTAVIAAKYGIQVHAVQVLSTHIHEVLTDVHGNLPKFMRERNRLLANSVKVLRKWPEEVFQRAPANYTRLYGVHAVLKEIAYTIANVVRAGLVEHPSQWPGATVLAHDIGERTIDIERPAVYFDAKNPIWPERVSLKITMPTAIVDAFGDSAKEILIAAVDAAIDRARREAIRDGYIVTPTRRNLCSEPTTRRSKSYEAFGKRVPTFSAAGIHDKRLEAIAERREFLERYRCALAALRKGSVPVAFPPGTWRWTRELLPEWMRDAVHSAVVDKAA